MTYPLIMEWDRTTYMQCGRRSTFIISDTKRTIFMNPHYSVGTLISTLTFPSDS